MMTYLSVRVQVARRRTHAWLERWQVHRRSEGGAHNGRERQHEAARERSVMNGPKPRAGRTCRTKTQSTCVLGVGGTVKCCRIGILRLGPSQEL